MAVAKTAVKKPATKATTGTGKAATKPAPAKTTAARKAPARKAAPAAAPLPQVEPIDAATLLKADHRAVDAMFEAFDDARGKSEKSDLVARICTALKIHTMIEEEVFYPALRGKIDDSIIDEAYVEHDGAKVLVNDLSTGSPADAMYDAKVKVLAEEIRHHVKEEERWLTGMFAKARSAGVDMIDLGTKMAARKAQLEADAAAAPLPVAKPTAVKLVTA
ncbi:MAG: hemerythrin domain-containing protein [Sphingomonadaceae bacterium]|nr:hemerythrin domain-containing protein [Sphingomonadaceae bacterium]